jgi:hypothetical protein
MNTELLIQAYTLLDEALPAFADRTYGSFMEHLLDYMLDHCDHDDVEQMMRNIAVNTFEQV